MFTQSAWLYDALYAFKDYAGEAEHLHGFIEQYKQSPGNTLLDVACGTGRHLLHLRRWYAAEGLDVNPDLLEIARQRNPDAVFHRGDMTAFDLGRQFDIITCLFSAIGYVKTRSGLQKTFQTLARSVVPGGVVLVEPWFSPETFSPGYLHALWVDQPELKVSRMSVSQVAGDLSVLNFHYLVGTSAGIDYFTERHELGLFTHEEYLEAFRAAGLAVAYDAQGLDGRGLYIGTQPRE